MKGTLANAVGFTITTTAAIAPPAGQSAQLVININGNGAASPSKFYAPIAGLNGGACGANGCNGLGGLPNPTGGHTYSAPFQQGMSVQIYPTDICADYVAKSSGQRGFWLPSILLLRRGRRSRWPTLPPLLPPQAHLCSSPGRSCMWTGGFNIVREVPRIRFLFISSFQASAAALGLVPVTLGARTDTSPATAHDHLGCNGVSASLQYKPAILPRPCLHHGGAASEASPPTPTAPVLDPTFINSPPTQSSANPRPTRFIIGADSTNAEIIPNPANTNVSFLNTTGGSDQLLTL